MTITPGRLREIAALCDKATIAPWNVGGGSFTVRAGSFSIALTTSAADTRFIASSRTAIPELLAEVARLQSDLDHASTYSPFDAAPCPLCEYADGRHTKPCAMHAEIDGLQATIARLRTEVGETRLVLDQQDRDLERQRAELSAAQAEAKTWFDAGCKIAGENDAKDARIAALETALREACNWIADRSPDGSMLVDRLRAVADAVESRKT